MKEYMQDGAANLERTHEKIATVIGRLKDLGIGNPKGIPSEYAKASDVELQEIAERARDTLVFPTDLTAAACIDGRRTLKNADGSAPEIRLRRVGGSASDLGVSLNANASVVDTLWVDRSLGKQIKAVENYIERLTGFERSAHLGGCGGALGEIADNKAIYENPAILGVTKKLMNIPAVKEYFGVGYDDELEEIVRENAGKTATFLTESGWDGATYVEGVETENPRGVEDLEVDHHDELYHGHKERSLKIVIGDKTVDEDDDFVWNLKASKEVAEALGAGPRGTKGYAQALMAEVAKHVAVTDRLASTETPVFLLAD